MKSVYSTQLSHELSEGTLRYDIKNALKRRVRLRLKFVHVTFKCINP